METKKLKKEKTPSKFKVWKKKMKETPKGRAYLKLIYWGIFFVALFIFLIVSSMITSNYQDPQSYEDDSAEETKVPDKTELNLEAILDMQQDLLMVLIIISIMLKIVVVVIYLMGLNMKIMKKVIRIIIMKVEMVLLNTIKIVQEFIK